MRLFRWLLAIVASICLSGLVAVCFASAAGAQVSPHASHLSHAALSTQELAVGLAHGATLGTVVFLAGLVAFVALVWLPASRAESGDQEKIAGLFCRWMWVLASLLVAGGMAELPLYAVRASGEALSFGLLREALFDTRVGHLWMERIVLGVMAATAATYATRLQRPFYWWGMGAAVAASVLLLTTLTQQSHAAAEEYPLPFAADCLHVVAASLWMGGLLGFPILLAGPLRVVPGETRARLFRRSVRRFSKVATIAVMVLVTTGLYAALLHVPNLSALVSTPYGRALSMKLGLLVFLLALGAQNLRLQGRGPFGRLVSAELVLAIGIFVATGFLTSLPPADAVQQQNLPSPTGDTKQSTML
jgi:copper transport protein